MPALRPSVSESAAAIIRGEICLHPEHEHQFVCGYDAATRTITSAALLFRGRHDRVPMLSTEYKPGTVAIHNHPRGGPPEPSASDIDAARELAQHGVGFGIVDNLCTSLFMVREPRWSVWQLMEPPQPTRRSWSWSWWRFLLVYMEPPKESPSPQPGP